MGAMYDIIPMSKDRALPYKHIHTENVHFMPLIVSLLACVLLTFAITSKTWYSLYIDVEHCAQCSPLIVAVGDAFADFTVTNFTVQEYIRVFFGMWDASICTAEHVCVDMKLSDVGSSLGSVRLFKYAIVSLHVGLVFLLPAYLGALSSLVCTLTSKLDSQCIIWLSVLSGVLSWCAGLTNGWIYFIGDFVTLKMEMCLPLAAIATMLAGYLNLYCGYSAWKSKTVCDPVFRLNSCQYWKYRRKKMSV